MYCTIENISSDMTLQTLIKVSNDRDNAETVNEALVQSKIDEAGSYIDGILASARYSLPVTDPSDMTILRSICVSLVVCDLYQRRFPLDYSDALASRRKLALGDLEKIRNQSLRLNTGTTLSGPGMIRVSAREKYFTDEALRSY